MFTTTESKSHWIAFCIIILLGFAAYSNVLPYPFVHDDIVFIQQNPNIGKLWDWRSAFISPQWPQDPSIIVGYWRPLLEIIHRLQYALWGFFPVGYHMFNVAVHLANAVFLYFILMRVTAQPLMGLTLSLAFLLHPAQSEAVACVAGVSNLLFAFFGLSSVLFFLFWWQKLAGRWALGWLLLSYAAFAKALLAKEQAVVFFLLLPLTAWVSLRQERIVAVHAWLAWSGFAIISGFYLSLRARILGSSAPDIFANIHELVLRLKAVAHMIITHTKVLLWPVDLHYYRSIDVLAPNTVHWIILGVILAGVIFALRGMQRAHRRLAVFGLGWFVIALAPTLNIFPLIIEYSKVSVAEHFLYLPMVGFFVFIAVCLESGGKVFSQPQRWQATGIIWMILILAATAATRQQNTFWRGEIPLFERTLTYEDLGRVRILLGRAYYFNKQYPEAAGEYTKALTLMQDYKDKAGASPAAEIYKGFIKGIYFDLAHVRADSGNFLAAVSAYEEAIRLDPQDAVLYNNLASVYLRSNDLPRAAELLQQALALDPEDIHTMNNLALVYIQQGQAQQARALLEKILEFHPAFGPARQNLEQLLRQE